jgi:hypothetical protein
MAPVVHNFDRIAPNPDVLSLFFAVGVLLVVPKAAFFFIWLNSSRIAMYRHLVISPLTAMTPRSPTEFLTESFHDEKARDEKPRSVASRIFWSFDTTYRGQPSLYSCSVGNTIDQVNHSTELIAVNSPFGVVSVVIERATLVDSISQYRASLDYLLFSEAA